MKSGSMLIVAGLVMVGLLAAAPVALAEAPGDEPRDFPEVPDEVIVACVHLDLTRTPPAVTITCFT